MQQTSLKSNVPAGHLQDFWSFGGAQFSDVCSHQHRHNLRAHQTVWDNLRMFNCWILSDGCLLDSFNGFWIPCVFEIDGYLLFWLWLKPIGAILGCLASHFSTISLDYVSLGIQAFDQQPNNIYYSIAFESLNDIKSLCFNPFIH